MSRFTFVRRLSILYADGLSVCRVLFSPPLKFLNENKNMTTDQKPQEPHKNTNENNDNGDDGCDNEIELWTREETPQLKIPITEKTSIQLKQRTSDDDRWGIYSTVWDGGVGTLTYLTKRYLYSNDETSNVSSSIEKSTLLLDVGSGTGIVGLGMSLLGLDSIVTDLAVALPLLEENIQLNSDKLLGKCQAKELAWGPAALPPDIETSLNEAAHVMIVGADIIYRRPLFDPLLQTLSTLLACRPDAECIIGAWSGRSYFLEFCELACSDKYNFEIHPKCYLVVDEDKGAMLEVVNYGQGTLYCDVKKGEHLVNIYQFILNSK